jgi:hypothetical protein
MPNPSTGTFKSFAEFYPHYLQEHSNDICRRLHYIGSLLALAFLAYTLLTLEWIWLPGVPLAGYGFAWVGHFVFEKNKPAAFKQPLYSMLGDWVMLKDALSGRIRF